MKKNYLFLMMFLVSASLWAQQRETIFKERMKMNNTRNIVSSLQDNETADFSGSNNNHANLPVIQSGTYLLHESFEGEFPTEGWSFLPQPIIHPMYNNSYWPMETGPLPPWYMVDLDVTVPPEGGNIALWASPHFDGEPGESSEKWAISPEVAVGMPSSLVFWTRNGLHMLDSLDIVVSVSGENPEDFTHVIDKLGWNSTSEWTMHTYDLLPFMGQTIRIGFRNHKEDNMWHGGGLFIDMVSVIEHMGPPECAVRPVPGDNTTSVNPFNATLAWDAVGATSYDIYLGETLPEAPVENVQTRWYMPQLEPNTSYQWKVVPKSTMGEAAECPTWHFTTGNVEHEYFMNDNEEVTACEGSFYDSGGQDLPYHLNDQFTKTFLPGQEGDRMRIQFDKLMMEIGWDFLYVYDGPDSNSPQVPGSPFSDGAVPLVLKNLAATNPQGALTFKIEADDIISKEGWEAMISCFTPQENALFVKSMQFNRIVKQSEPTQFTLLVQNEGTSALEQFSIDLINAENDTNMGSYSFEHNLQPGEYGTITFEHTFTENGNFNLFAQPLVAGMNNPVEGASQTESVAVLNNHSSLTIGMPQEQSILYPYNKSWEKSVFQVIYMAEEIERMGNISGMGFLKNSVSDYEFPVKIWVGETSKSTLDSGLEDVSEHTLVFDGTTFIGAGEGYTTNEFIEPFLYQGQNLVVTIMRVFEEVTYQSEGNFMFVEQTPQYPGRALSFIHDSFYHNPENPLDPGPAGVDNLSLVPSTVFFFSDDETGAIEGQVTLDSEEAAPEVTTSIQNTLLQATTNNDGNFAFPSLLQGAYNLTVQKFGYQDMIAEDVQVVEGQTTEVNFIMQALPMVEISGIVSVAGNPDVFLENAVITLEGYENHEVVSDPNGAFSIPDVFGLKTYQIHISKPGYQTYSAEIMIDSDDVNLGVTELSIIPYAPFFVTAEELDQDMKISWAGDFYNGFGLQEGFENDFMDQGWSRVITNEGETYDGYPFHWEQHGFVPYGEYDEIPVVFGEKQVGVLPDYSSAQDEWLITPSIKAIGSLSFWMYGYLGSEAGDEYMVAVTTDEGETWDVIWQASLQSPGWNLYDTPVEIDLTEFFAQDIKIAFIAQGAQWDDETYGLEYPWFIDNVNVGMSKLSFDKFQWQNSGNPLSGYSLYRFKEGDEIQDWQLIDNMLQDTLFVDDQWSELPFGTYRYAVKANYNDGQESSATISNPVHNKMELSVPVNVSTTSGQPANGARIWFFHQELQEKDKVFTYQEGDNYLASDLWRGNYDVKVSLSGYEIFDFGLFEVIEGATLSVVLEERIVSAVNLEGEAENENISLWWEKETQTADMTWMLGDIEQGFGVSYEPMLEVATRFTPLELVTVDKMKLEEVSFHSYNGQASYFLVIRKGGTPEKPSAPVHVQEITEVTSNAWNVVELDSEIIIDAEEDLWIGLEMEIYDDFCIGVDSGPAFPEKGNLIRQGDSFVSTLELHGSLDFNWAIKGHFSETPYGEPNGENSSRQFHIYRNEENIAQVDADTYSFSDAGLPNGIYTYYVVAEYFNASASPSNSVTIEVDNSTVDITPVDLASGMKVFPNPASHEVNIKFLERAVYHIQMLDLSGNVVKDFSSEDASVHFSIDGLTPGVYVIKIQSDKLTRTEKITIVR